MNSDAFDHPSEALARDLAHDANVAMQDLGLSQEEAARTVVEDSDYVPENMEAHYVEAVQENLDAGTF